MLANSTAVHFLGCIPKTAPTSGLCVAKSLSLLKLCVCNREIEEKLKCRKVQETCQEESELRIYSSIRHRSRKVKKLSRAVNACK